MNLSQLEALYDADHTFHKVSKSSLRREVDRFDHILDFLLRTIDSHFKGKKKKDQLRVLEIGPGHGATAFHLSDQGIHVEVLDVSQKVLKHCEEHAGIRKAWHKNCWDSKSLEELKGQYDVVIARSVIEHCPHPQLTMSLWAGLLKKGGLLYLTTPIGKELIDPYHLYFFYWYDLVNILDPGAQFDTLEKPMLTDYSIMRTNKYDPQGKYNMWVVLGVK